MGSKRFPGKMAIDLCGYPIIEWVIRRCQKSNLINNIVLATSIKKENDYLIDKAKLYGIKYYRGSEKNVLSRFIAIAKRESADIIVRICADNPLVCPTEIDRIIESFLINKPDYAFNHIPKLGNKYVNGVGVEVLSIGTLMNLNAHVTLKEHKEHVTKYIWDNFDQFSINTLKALKNLQYPEIRLDIDTKSDFAYMSSLIRKNQSWKYPEDVFVPKILKNSLTE